VNEANRLTRRWLSRMFQQNKTIGLSRIDHTSCIHFWVLLSGRRRNPTILCPGCASACIGQHQKVNVMAIQVNVTGQIGSTKGSSGLGLEIRLTTFV
jgi:hypothetical protein